MSDHLQKIFAVWRDNAEAMAADIGELGVTVRAWRNRQKIPSDYWPRIIRAAASRGAELALVDFLPPAARAELDAPLDHDALASQGAASSPVVTGPSATKAGENIRDQRAGAPA